MRKGGDFTNVLKSSPSRKSAVITSISFISRSSLTPRLFRGLIGGRINIGIDSSFGTGPSLKFSSYSVLAALIAGSTHETG